MPTDRPAQRFGDIISNVDLIRAYVAGADYEAFAADSRTVNAVLYCLLRIGEAVRKLDGTAPALAPAVPWVQIRRFANILRHDYDSVDLPLVWNTIIDDLPPLREACLAAIAALDPSSR